MSLRCARAIILTGCGNIATAVSVVKIGAFDYLANPADARPKRALNFRLCSGLLLLVGRQFYIAGEPQGPEPNHLFALHTSALFMLRLGDLAVGQLFLSPLKEEFSFFPEKSYKVHGSLRPYSGVEGTLVFGCSCTISATD